MDFEVGFSLVMKKRQNYNKTNYRELQDWKVFHVVLFAQAAIVFVTPL